jgi:hypothetical protein
MPGLYQSSKLAQVFSVLAVAMTRLVLTFIAGHLVLVGKPNYLKPDTQRHTTYFILSDFGNKSGVETKLEK